MNSRNRTIQVCLVPLSTTPFKIWMKTRNRCQYSDTLRVRIWPSLKMSFLKTNCAKRRRKKGGNRISRLVSSSQNLEKISSNSPHGKLVISQSTLKARFYGHRFSGKAGFSGQYCYDGATVFSNNGNFNIADTFWRNFF